MARSEIYTGLKEGVKVRNLVVGSPEVVLPGNIPVRLSGDDLDLVTRPCLLLLCTNIGVEYAQLSRVRSGVPLMVSCGRGGQSYRILKVKQMYN